MIKEYDYIILGAGIYGLYAATILAKKNLKIAIVEVDKEPFQRASYINQARIHNGYHYPRSLSTAITSAKYFNRFNDDFSFAINKEFKKVYAVSSSFSLVSTDQFKKFCQNANITFDEINLSKYFKPDFIESAFETKEYSFDAFKIRDYFIEKIKQHENISCFFQYKFNSVESKNGKYYLTFENGETFSSEYIINATYASINQVASKFNFELLKIKYELCEVILCEVSSNLTNVGLTVMDGPFFSLMPFGFSGVHSLTSVTFTPKLTSHDFLPTFNCQEYNHNCTPLQLDNCNLCDFRPKTTWPYMSQMASKFLNKNSKVSYKSSLFAIKSISEASEVDDSRPTVIKVSSKDPTFISILSGKINTIYDIEEYLL